jgi:hypothetical protein
MTNPADVVDPYASLDFSKPKSAQEEDDFNDFS